MNIKMVYMYAPANFKTGGTELCHQLVRLYNDNNIPSIIAYVGIKDGINPINDAFKVYVDKYVSSDEIEDDSDIIVIVPEVYTNEIKRFKKAKKVIWWMSVDNFEMHCGFMGAIKHCGLLRAIKYFLLKKLNNSINTLNFCDVHVYQSEYAKKYLLNNKFDNLLPLSDYFNDRYFEPYQAMKRCDYVLYNPRKGFAFTKKIMKAFPNYKWKGIENMSNSEVIELLRHSKVYIDFGNHPGKDRFPREAAISGCCIIVGRRGSAFNDIDIPIPNKYKFLDKESSIVDIGNMISNCLSNYEIVSDDFNHYRLKIMQEKNTFKKEALYLIEYFKLLDK